MSHRSLPALLRSACVTALILLPTTTAHADDGPGAFRIALSTELVGYTRERLPEFEDHLGRRAEVSREEIVVALATPRVGLELAGVVDPMILVGVTTALTYRARSLDDGSSESVVGWRAIAWLELFLLPDDVARPFVRAGLGAAGAEAWDPHARELQAVLALTAGAHLFASDDVSIDPFASLTYRAGTTSSGHFSRPVEDVELFLGVSLSAWLGGRAPAPVSTAEERSPASTESEREAR